MLQRVGCSSGCSWSQGAVDGAVRGRGSVGVTAVGRGVTLVGPGAKAVVKVGAWGRLWLGGVVDIAVGDGGTVGGAAVVSGVNQFGPVCFGIVVVGVKEGAVLLGVLRGKSAYFCARGTGLLEKSL